MPNIFDLKLVLLFYFIDMPRLKPYNTNQESWNTILHKYLRIPMNQREYSWELTEITKFLDDIFKIYDKSVNKKYKVAIIDYEFGNSASLKKK